MQVPVEQISRELSLSHSYYCLKYQIALAFASMFKYFIIKNQMRLGTINRSVYLLSDNLFFRTKH
jgi:hypothetical protein